MRPAGEARQGRRGRYRCHRPYNRNPKPETLTRTPNPKHQTLLSFSRSFARLLVGERSLAYDLSCLSFPRACPLAPPHPRAPPPPLSSLFLTPRPSRRRHHLRQYFRRRRRRRRLRLIFPRDQGHLSQASSFRMAAPPMARSLAGRLVLHPAPYTLYPTPYTLHPPPSHQTLDPRPYTARASRSTHMIARARSTTEPPWSRLTHHPTCKSRCSLVAHLVSPTLWGSPLDLFPAT